VIRTIVRERPQLLHHSNDQSDDPAVEAVKAGAGAAADVVEFLDGSMPATAPAREAPLRFIGSPTSAKAVAIVVDSVVPTVTVLTVADELGKLPLHTSIGITASLGAVRVLSRSVPL
jgi:hypothetical protein